MGGSAACRRRPPVYPERSADRIHSVAIFSIRRAQSMRVGIPALLVAFSIAPLAADEPVKSMTIQLSGAVEKPAEWSLEEIAKTFAADVTEVSYTLKGQAGKAHVVPLVKLVLAAKPKIDPAQKNHIIAFSV